MSQHREDIFQFYTERERNVSLKGTDHDFDMFYYRCIFDFRYVLGIPGLHFG